MLKRFAPVLLVLLLCMCMGVRLAAAGEDHKGHGHDDHGHEKDHGHGHDDHKDHDGHDDHDDHDHDKVAAKSAPYPLTTCTVSGMELDAKGSPVAYDHKGRDLKFCCKGCLAAFKKDPKKYIAILDKAIVKQSGPKYPLTVDVVTGAKLGAKPVNYVYRNHLVRFANMDSIDAFEANPAKFIKKIEAARAKQAKQG